MISRFDSHALTLCSVSLLSGARDETGNLRWTWAEWVDEVFVAGRDAMISMVL